MRFTLDESDVNAIKPGQRVMVTGPGFQGVMLRGKIHSVAGQASNAGGGPKASFVVTARLDPLTPAQAQLVRIGMSANIRVRAAGAADAISIPQQAIQAENGQLFVTVRDPGRKELRKVPVQIGRVAPNSVEILSGLKPGDTLVWTPRVSAPPSPSD